MGYAYVNNEASYASNPLNSVINGSTVGKSMQFPR